MSDTPATPDADHIPPQTQDRRIGLESELEPPAQHIRDDYKGAGKLAGKRTLITGGDSGIGRAVALHFAREGADVAILYTPDEKEDGDEAKRLIEAEGARALAITGDISGASFCQSAVEQVVEAFGGLDVLVNNAAIMKPGVDLETVSDELWRRHFDVNVHGMFYLTKAALAHLREGGSIINTTSVNAFAGDDGGVAYTATKGAIAGFTRSMALQLSGRKIRVNEVAPGPIWTPLQPAGWGPVDPEQVPHLGDMTAFERMGQPSELGPAYVYLASADSSYVTGQTIHVNGGMIVNA